MSIWKVTIVYNLDDTPRGEGLLTEEVGIRASTLASALVAGREAVECREKLSAANRWVMGAGDHKVKVNHHRASAEELFRLYD
jgi:hypothetical protein